MGGGGALWRCLYSVLVMNFHVLDWHQSKPSFPLAAVLGNITKTACHQNGFFSHSQLDKVRPVSFIWFSAQEFSNGFIRRCFRSPVLVQELNSWSCICHLLLSASLANVCVGTKGSPYGLMDVHASDARPMDLCPCLAFPSVSHQPWNSEYSDWSVQLMYYFYKFCSWLKWLWFTK